MNTTVSKTIAAARAAADDSSSSETTSKNQPPPRNPRLRRGPAGGNNYHDQLERLPGIERLAAIEDPEVRSVAQKALEKYERAMTLLEDAADIRRAEKALIELHELGLVIPAGLESKAWFQPADPDFKRHREIGEAHVRQQFLSILIAECWPQVAAARMKQVERLRIRAAAARESDEAFRREWPSAASNEVLFCQIEHAIDWLEWEATQEPRLDWHFSMRTMVNSWFISPI